MCWIDHARRYLTTGDNEHLEKARDEIEQPDIKAFISNILKGFISDPNEDPALAQRLEAEERLDEGAIIRLLSFFPHAIKADSPDCFPPAAREVCTNFSFGACEECINIAQDRNFPEVEARFLQTLGTGYARLSYRDKAKELLEKAVEKYKSLPKKQLDLYLHLRADALACLANVFRDCRQLSEARELYEDLVGVYRKLSEQDPDLYLPDLAMALSNLGSVLYDQEAYPKAKEASEEARDKYRELISKGEHIYHPNLASALCNLGNTLSKLHKFPDASRTLSEALKLYVLLEEDNPGLHLHDIAHAKISLGCSQLNQQEFDDADTNFQKALEIYIELSEKQPRVYKPFVGAAAAYRGIALEKLGKEDARSYFEMSVSACEHESLSPDEVYLVRGGIAENAYNRMIGFLAEDGDDDGVFRHLVALTEPEAMPRPGALNRVHLKMLNRSDGNRTLVIEDLKQGTFVGILGYSKEIPFKYELIDYLASRKREFWDAYYEWRRALEQAVNEDSTDHSENIASIPEAVANAINKMVSATRSFWETLPSWVRVALHPDSGGEISISTSSWWAFPFALIPFEEGPESYLGLHRPLPKLAGMSERYLPKQEGIVLGNGDRTAILFANPTCDLDSSEAEIKVVAEALHDFRTVIKTRYDATDIELGNFLRKPFAVFHYSGHGTIFGPPESEEGFGKLLTGEEALLLNGKHPFAASMVRHLDFHTSPLIVLNSCLTGRTRLHGGMREDLAGSFLRQGAESVIATGIRVSTQVARVFGEVLYKQEEVEIQLAFFNARKIAEKIARDKYPLYWPCWGFYTLHGNPFAHMPHVNKQ